MKLLGQMIRKNLELYEESFINKRYKEGVSWFYQAYNISLAVVEVEDQQATKKNNIWKKFLLRPNKVNSKYFKMLRSFMHQDTKIIIDAVEIIDKKSEEMGFDFGDTYKEGTLGILAYEYPEENL